MHFKYHITDWKKCLFLKNRRFDIYTFQEKGIKIVYLDALLSRVEGDVGVFLCHKNDQNYWYQIVLAYDSGKHHILCFNVIPTFSKALVSI